MTSLSWMAGLKLEEHGKSVIDKDIYAIHVSFYQYEGWSRTYTYKSYVPYAPNSIVLVEKRAWYNIGRVIKSELGFEFSPNVDYKFIIKEITL